MRNGKGNEVTTTNSIEEIVKEPLAILGGPKAVPDGDQHEDLFHWPVVTEEDERAVVEVLRAGTMSGLDVTRQFEDEFAEYQGVRYALGHPNGTMALLAAIYAAGLRRGDELICPSVTFWACAVPAFSLGATVVFADIHPESLCIDPGDIERHVSRRTKAIMAVHYCGHPADMEPVMAVARKHRLKVIEDVSHAHGALYRSRMVGTFGDVSAMSMMAGKSLAIGEAGMLVTDDREIHERTIAFCHYERIAAEVEAPDLAAMAMGPNVGPLPLGGAKGRLNQVCSAMGRVQLKHYPQRMAEIQRAMNRFWDLLNGTPGIRPHRPPEDSASTMGGWYNPVGHYLPEHLDGLPVARFVEAVRAEGGRSRRGINFPLHLHPLFNDADVYGDGKPTRTAFSDRDLRQPPGSLPVAEGAAERTFGIPWFKHDRPGLIERYAAAYRKVALQADKLL